MSNKETQTKYISEHIPKTGGYSTRIFFSESFPQNSVYLHYRDKGGLFHASESVSLEARFPIVTKLKTFLLSPEDRIKFYRLIKPPLRPQSLVGEVGVEWRVIHGHKALEFAGKYSEAKLITVIRNPLERAISQYFYVNQRSSSGRPLPEWAIGIETKLSLADYLLDDSLANYQTKYIKPLSWTDFSVIGVVESLEEYCARINRTKKKYRLKKTNVTTKPNFSLNRDFVEKFVEQNRDDYDIYLNTKKQWCSD